MKMKVGLWTRSFTPSALAKAWAKVVLPAPRLPISAKTSPPFMRLASAAAILAVSLEPLVSKRSISAAEFPGRIRLHPLPAVLFLLGETEISGHGDHGG